MPTRSKLVATRSPSGLGLPPVVEQAYNQSPSGRVRVEVVPTRLLDGQFYANVVLPSLGAKNIQFDAVGPVRADITRSTFEQLINDPEIDELNVARQPQSNGSGGGNNTTGASSGGFLTQNWPWLLGIAGAGIALQFMVRSGRRQVARKNEGQGDRAISSGDEGIERSNPHPDHEALVVVPVSMDADEVTASSGQEVENEDLSGMAESDQRSLAHEMRLSPGDQVTVYHVDGSSAGATGNYEWTPEGFVGA